MRRSGGSTIAPLYDLATGLAYDAVDVDRRIALSVGGERLTSRIQRQQWAKASATLGIDPHLMQARVVRLAEALPAAFTEAIEEVGDVPGMDEIADRVPARLIEYCQRMLSGLA